ncbi:MAG: sigma-54-dependent transcriptional regulator [Candidatus Zixiibacteriota bacterium]
MNRNQIKILVVDDEARTAKLLCEFFSDEGFDSTFALSASDAISLFKDTDFDILITDLKMPRIDGIELLSLAKERSSRIHIILMTAHATVETAVEAMKKGAADYIIKPFDEEILLKKVENIIKSNALYLNKKENAYEIIGKSRAIQELRGQIKKVADSDATVLITGESGTGKELVARNIHRLSSRNIGPFVDINCAAISENLLESELFGYEKGAFTGADKRKIGLFEAAEGGSIFLDEIGEMPFSLQAKLLRVLQQRRIHRLGSVKDIDINVRIIAATNRNLKKMVDEKNFRSDLYFRLSVFPIETPALREHQEDMALLLKYFLGDAKLPDDDSKSELIEYLKSYNWPGNIRELQNAIKRATILAGKNPISKEHFELKTEKNTSENPRADNVQKLEDVEKNMLVDALEKAQGNKTKAARILGITRRMIYSKMDKYDLR